MVAIVIGEALALYRRLAAPLIAATALCFAPLALAVLALGRTVPDSQQAEQGLQVIDAAGSFLLCSPLATLIAIRAAIALERDGAARIRSAVGPAFADLAVFVLTQVLMVVVIAALPGVLIAAGLAAGSPAMTGLGAAALLGSLLVNGVRLAMAPVAVAVGDARLAPALRRSAALTRGRWLAVLATLLAASAIVLLASAGFAALVLPFPAGLAQDAASAVIAVAANAVTVPFLALAAYRLYRALSERGA